MAKVLDVKSNQHGVYYKVNSTSILPQYRDKAQDSSEVEEYYQRFLDILQPEQVKTTEEIFSEQ